MEGEILYNGLEEYIDELKKLGINRIAMAETRERRPVYMDGDGEGKLGTIDVVVVKRSELLAYRESRIYKCVVNDVEPDEVFRTWCPGVSW
jgi:hypothetical protein